MFHINHSDSSLVSPDTTHLSGWVRKTEVSADTDIKLLTESVEKHFSCYVSSNIAVSYSRIVKA